MGPEPPSATLLRLEPLERRSSIPDLRMTRSICEFSLAIERFRKLTTRQNRGAVKSNVGHLEGSSGLAGVVKTVLALEKAVIPPNSNFETLNPRIDADFFNLRFPTECVPWPGSPDHVRRASVNSFGFGVRTISCLPCPFHIIRNYLMSRRRQVSREE